MINKSVLCIGSEGYIGSYIAPRLRERYSRVTTVDIAPGADIQKNYKDLTPAEIVYYDTIILLAGYSSVPMCEQGRWYNTYVNNVRNFIEFLDMIPPDIKFLYASSGSVYNGIRNANECSLLFSPINPYDASKVMIDKAAAMSNLEGKNAIGLRFGTVCGKSPNQRMDLVLQRMAWNAIHKNVVNVYNPDSYRTLLSLRDLYRGIESIIDCNNIEPGVVNLGSCHATMSVIGRTVGDFFRVPVVIHPGDSGYSFTMSTVKSSFFYDTEDSITTMLMDFNAEYLGSIKEEDFDKYTREVPYIR